MLTTEGRVSRRSFLQIVSMAGATTAISCLCCPQRTSGVVRKRRKYNCREKCPRFLGCSE